jgi:hypothetical protein
LAARFRRPVFENVVRAAERLAWSLVNLAGVKSIQSTLLATLATSQSEGEDQTTGEPKRHCEFLRFDLFRRTNSSGPDWQPGTTSQTEVERYTSLQRMAGRS